MSDPCSKQPTAPNFNEQPALNVPPQETHISPPPYSQGPPPQPPQYQTPQYPTTNYVAPAFGNYPGPYGTTYYNNYGLYMRRMPVSVMGMSIGIYWAYVLIIFGTSTLISGIIMATIYTSGFSGINIAGVVMICIAVIFIIAGVVIAVKSRRAFNKYLKQNANQQQQQQGTTQATPLNSSTAEPNGQLPVYNYSSNPQTSPRQF